MLQWIPEADDDGEQARIRLRGTINERTTFDEWAVDGPRLVLIADGVRYINSTGLKRFWAFLQPLTTRYAIRFERCSPALVAQLNMMPALAESVSVRSLIAPLECTECVAETDVLVEVSDGQPRPSVPARTCEICGAPMVLAELEERYFAFLR